MNHIYDKGNDETTGRGTFYHKTKSPSKKLYYKSVENTALLFEKATHF